MKLCEARAKLGLGHWDQREGAINGQSGFSKEMRDSEETIKMMFAP